MWHISAVKLSTPLLAGAVICSFKPLSLSPFFFAAPEGFTFLLRKTVGRF
jgi:hypothetical protein